MTARKREAPRGKEEGERLRGAGNLSRPPQAARVRVRPEHEAAAAPRCSGFINPFARAGARRRSRGSTPRRPRAPYRVPRDRGRCPYARQTPLRAPRHGSTRDTLSARPARKPGCVHATAVRLVALRGGRQHRRPAGGVGAGRGGGDRAHGAGGRGGHDGRGRRRRHCAAHRRASAPPALHAASFRSLSKQCLQRGNTGIRAAALQRDSALHQPCVSLCDLEPRVHSCTYAPAPAKVCCMTSPGSWAPWR